MAVKMIEKWEEERKEMEKTKAVKEKEYSRAIDETEKHIRNITSLKEKLKGMRVAVTQTTTIYEERIAELTKKNKEKDARLAKLEVHNTHMEAINNDLEKRVKIITVGKRKLKEEKRREDLMRKQLVETPIVDVPYFGDFKEREGRLGPSLSLKSPK